MTGAGTEANPYIIYDINDLNAVRNDLSAWYELANNIDASDTSTWNSGAGWSPLGIFLGHFHGRFHAISDLYINRTSGTIGLFSQISGTALVQHLKITDANVYSERSCSANCAITLGILTGFVTGGTVHCVYTSGSAHAYVNDTSSYQGRSLCMVGGIAGQQTGGTISSCGNDASVYAQQAGVAISYAGGIIGRANGGAIEDSYNGGAIAGQYDGGLVGGNYVDALPTTDGCTVSNSHSYGTADYGLVALLSGGPPAMSNCFWDTEASGTAVSADGTGKTTAQMKDITTFTGWDFTNDWIIDPSVNSGYPIPQCLYKSVYPPFTFTFPDLMDDHGRRVKNVPITAYRCDTHQTVETQNTDDNGQATFTALPVGQDIMFHAIWGASAIDRQEGGGGLFSKERWFYLEFKDIEEGGKGAFSAEGAQVNLGLIPSVNVQSWDDDLDDIAALTPADSNFIVGDGTNWRALNGLAAFVELWGGKVGELSIDAGEVTAEVAADNTRIAFDLEGVT